MEESKTYQHNYQTPPVVCDYMCSMLPDNCGRVLEPTPGEGNLVNAIIKSKKAKGVVAPNIFEGMVQEGKELERFDYVVMNPPFTPMQEGYRYLSECMKMSDNIIALLPWFILINSERRLNEITGFGLKSVTALPRKTFPGCRIQVCVLQLEKGYKGETLFKTFSW